MVFILDFDQIIFDQIEKKGGFYQRYCDDLIIVIERQFETEVINLLRDTVKGEVARLIISPEKTKLYHFEPSEGQHKCFFVDEETKVRSNNKPLEYLGFSFDGK